MRAIALLAFLGFVPGAALAGGGSESGDPAVIVVIGAGLPLPPGTPAYGTTIIDRATLLGSASDRLENILGNVAGFQEFRRSDSRSANPSAQGATLRALGGNASSRTLVLLDGVPIADPFFGFIPFNAIAPERLAVARVTRGGGNGAFGAGAVAGTIELASATRDQLPPLQATAFYGSKDASQLSASLSPNVGNGFVSISGRWDRGDGFQTTPRNQRVAATVPAAYHGWSLNFRAVAPLSTDSELQVRGTVFRDNRVLRFAGADSTSEGQDVSARFLSRGAWQVDALAYLQLRNFSNVVISSSTFRKSLDQRNTPSTGLGGKVELRPPLGPDHLLRLGADVRSSSGDMFEDAYNANVAANPLTARRHGGGRQVLAGVFAEDDWTLGPVVLTGGVRADHWRITSGFYRAESPAGGISSNDSYADRSSWEMSGRGGILYRVGEAIALRGAVYTGFRLPTLNELYRPFVVFPVTTQANASLSPERLKGAEIGMDLKPAAGVTLAVTAFYNKLGNAIANVTVEGNLRQRRNVDAIVAKGLELSGQAHIGEFLLSLSYAYSDSSVVAPGQAFNGLTPAQSPRHAANGTLAWQPRTGHALSTTIRYVSGQYEDDLQSNLLRSALTLDAAGRLALSRGVALSVRAENLLNTTVVTRNVEGSMDLGTPRTLWIGVTFSR